MTKINIPMYEDEENSPYPHTCIREAPIRDELDSGMTHIAPLLKLHVPSVLFH